MQIPTLSSNHRTNGRLLDTTTSMRLRAFRFMSERYMQRERTSFAAEFILFVLIVITATWPMFSLAQAMSLSR
jgi:hypothetical protein